MPPNAFYYIVVAFTLFPYSPSTARPTNLHVQARSYPQDATVQAFDINRRASTDNLWFEPSSAAAAAPTNDTGNWLHLGPIPTQIPSPTSKTSQAVPSEAIDIETVIANVATSASPSESPSITSTTAQPSGTASAVSPSGTADQVGWITAHNAARQAYGAGNLTWNTDLVTKAQANADLCSGNHTYIVLPSLNDPFW